jgi:hypothetical protein
VPGSRATYHPAGVSRTVAGPASAIRTTRVELDRMAAVGSRGDDARRAELLGPVDGCNIRLLSAHADRSAAARGRTRAMAIRIAEGVFAALRAALIYGDGVRLAAQPPPSQRTRQIATMRGRATRRGPDAIAK